MKSISRKENRIVRTGFTAGVLLLLLCAFSVTPVKAESNILGIIGAKNFTSTAIYPSASNVWSIGFEGLSSSSQNVKMTSSNKSMVKIKKGENAFALTIKKPGTTKLTVQFKNGKKNYKYTGTLKVVKFVNPFTTLKVNGKSYLSKVKKDGKYINIKSKKDDVNFLYKLKPGWKLSPVPKMFGRQDGTFQALKKVKNGKTTKITLPAEGGEIDFYAYNKKLGISERVFIGISK